MISIWHWHTEPALLGGILLCFWCYGMLVGPLRGWIDPEALYPRREVWWFGVAAAVFYFAVGSPLDALGENFLFSAHMVQHNILMYLVPVFTLWALPGWLIDGLLERLPSVVTASLRFLFHPLVAGVLFTFVFSVWHFPALYEWALHDRVVHVIEHLTMYGASFIALWPIFSRSETLPPMRWGGQILYVFLIMVAQIPLFGILTFASSVFYPTYEYAPRVIAWLDPQQDQVLGGLFMKVANMVLSLIIMARAFLLWNRSQESGRRTHPIVRHPLRAPSS
jgi:putative membrane protein